MNRREFLGGAALGAAALASNRKEERGMGGYDYRIAFGCWINDMRLEPEPLENWPAPQFDEMTIRSVSAAMDVQRDAGFNMLDAWGIFATYGWPPDIVSAVDRPRRRRIERLLQAAKQRGIVLSLGMGNYSWGYDKIIGADPDVRGKNPDGTPHAHAMCDANPKSFEYVKKILDFTLGQFDFGAVHLESCDLGCCFCPQCAGKDGVVGYNVRINTKAADYIKSKWPDKTVYVITINWIGAGKNFDAEQKAHVLELSKHVDCIFDQGHTGYQVAEADRREFIRSMSCKYGTSGRIWLYPDTKWDRHSYFLPYPRRAGDALRAQYEDGVRGCLHYQGPVNNPGQEVMIACGGRILSKPDRAVGEVLEEVLSHYYRPKTADAMRRLKRIFEVAEESYFGQWTEAPFRKLWGTPIPGEFKLDQRLFGTSPGPATYLKEPSLDAKGRDEYRKGLASVIEETAKLAGACDDHGRVAAIRRCAIIAINMLNTICYCLGEPIP